MTTAGIAAKKEAIERSKKDQFYHVTFAVEGTVAVSVKARDFHEAAHKAYQSAHEVDLGVLNGVSWKAIRAENEIGCWHDYT